MMTIPADDIEDEATGSQAASEQHSLTTEADKRKIDSLTAVSFP